MLLYTSKTRKLPHIPGDAAEIVTPMYGWYPYVFASGVMTSCRPQACVSCDTTDPRRSGATSMLHFWHWDMDSDRDSDPLIDVLCVMECDALIE